MAMKEMTIAEARALGYVFDSSLSDKLKVTCPDQPFSPKPESPATAPAFVEAKVADIKASGTEVVEGVPDQVTALKPA